MNYTLIKQRFEELNKIYLENGSIPNIIFTFEQYNFIPIKIKDLLKEDIAFVLIIIDFLKERFEMHIKLNDCKIEELNKTNLKFELKPTTQIKEKFNKYYSEVIDWLKTTDFFTNIYDSIQIISEEEIKKFKEENKKVLNNKKFKYRINQIKAFERLEKNGLETGIHCQATGCGKTYIILKYIDYTQKITKNPKVILFTERVNILADLFSFDKKTMVVDPVNITVWKEIGICDLTKFDIINRVTNKNKDWDKLLKKATKPTLLVINRAFLTLGREKLYKIFKKNDIDLVLHDECHNTSSVQCHDFLLHCKSINIPIVGFSATPLRTGRNDKSKLLQIYANPTDKNKLNLLTDFSMIYAISKGLILPPEFFWYQLDTYDKSNPNEIITQQELGSVLEILDHIMPNLPNKKLVAWCGTIKMAKEWKHLFEQNYKQRKNLKDFTFGLDTSETETGDYDKFKIAIGNTILFCASKHREGSDIRLLDGCIFCDKVKDRGAIPFIQSIGRVLRLCPNTPEKTKGVIIDGFVKKDSEYEKKFIEKIIGYYMSLTNISDIDENLDGDKYSKFIKLLDVINFDTVKEEIKLKIGKIEIKINCQKIEWNQIISKFGPLLQEKIKMSKEDIFEVIVHKLKETKLFNSKSDFWKIYKNLPNKIELGLPENLYEEYKVFFDKTTWYSLLDIDMSNYYQTILECKVALNKLSNNTKIDEKKYKKICKKNNQIPLFPEEFYKNQGFTTIESKFNDALNIQKIDF